MKKTNLIWIVTFLIIQNGQSASLTPYINLEKEFVKSNIINIQPLDWDIDHYKITVNSYYTTADIIISGEIRNVGNNTINSFSLVYQINDEGPVSSLISGLSLVPDESYHYVHPISWKASQAGSFKLKVWTEDINGNADMDSSNDTIAKTIFIGDPIPDIIDSYLTFATKNTIIGNNSEGVNEPRDLDFHPILNRFELWIINKGTEASGGSTVKFSNAGLPGQTSLLQKDGNTYHFMSLPTGIAFSENENFATSTGVFDANHSGGTPFTGPTLWSSDSAIYAKSVPGGNGSHLDMLHQSPYCMGICSESENIFWVTDGNNNDIVRYDFGEDHGPGQHDHSDGIIRRYPDAEFHAESTHDVVSHLVLDKTTNWLYYISTADKKVKRLNISTGSFDFNIPPYEGVNEYSSYANASVEDVITTGLEKPAGIELFKNRLLVSDFTTGAINMYDVSSGNANLMGIIETGQAGIMGIKVGPDGKIWYVNKTFNQVVRLDTTEIITGSSNLTENNALNIYPNPASTTLSIITDYTPAYIMICNMTGGVVKNIVPASSNSIINLTDLNSGIYMIRVNVNNQIRMKKIIKN
ncbi:MAG: T9SS type A sorting domain-containing protein [Bacteroidota bacterium]|nr:T9SS type A sorting domain-containing protein [Bacteroidota bacterium]